ACFLMLHHPGTGNEISVAQPHFASWREAVELFGRIFAEVVLLNVEHARKWNFSGSGAGVFWVIDCLHLLNSVFWIVVNHYPQRPQHTHDARRTLVQVFAN